MKTDYPCWCEMSLRGTSMTVRVMSSTGRKHLSTLRYFIKAMAWAFAGERFSTLRAFHVFSDSLSFFFLAAGRRTLNCTLASSLVQENAPLCATRVAVVTWNYIRRRQLPRRWLPRFNEVRLLQFYEQHHAMIP